MSKALLDQRKRETEQRSAREARAAEQRDFIDRAATAALQGLLAGTVLKVADTRAPRFVADCAYDYAEALWTEREKRGTGDPKP